MYYNVQGSQASLQVLHLRQNKPHRLRSQTLLMSPRFLPLCWQCLSWQNLSFGTVLG